MVTIDPAAEAVTIQYVSINPKIIQKIEKLTGIQVKNYVIPKRNWPDDRIIKEKIPVWYPAPTEVLSHLFPFVPESVAKKAFQLLGIHPDGQICFSRC